MKVAKTVYIEFDSPTNILAAAVAKRLSIYGKQYTMAGGGDVATGHCDELSKDKHHADDK